MKKPYCKPSFIVVKIQSRSHMLVESNNIQGRRNSYDTEDEVTWE